MPYHCHHGDTLSEAEAAHLLTRAAAGEILTHAPIKVGHCWTLAHLATLNAAQRRAYAQRVALTARVLNSAPVPAQIHA